MQLRLLAAIGEAQAADSSFRTEKGKEKEGKEKGSELKSRQFWLDDALAGALGGTEGVSRSGKN